MLSAVASAYFDENRFQMTFLNIGQGDSILIKTPNNSYGLIDTGPNSNVVDELRETMPLFKRSLDFVLLTHPDEDHVGGFLDVANSYNIKNLFVNKFNKETGSYKKILDWAFESDIKTFSIDLDNDFEIDQVSFDTIWPIDFTKTYQSENTNEESISQILEFKDLQVYLGGDLGENELLSLKNSKNPNIDVLKVGHHGSRYSSNLEFLGQTTPSIAIINVGKNSYGHPSREAIENFKSLNIQTLRTDMNGRITITYLEETNEIEVSCQFSCERSTINVSL